AAVDFVNGRLAELQSIAEVVGGSVDQARERVRGLVADLEAARKEQARLADLLAAGQLDALIAQAHRIGDLTVVAARVEAPNPDALRRMADGVRDKLRSVLVVLIATVGGTPALVVALTDHLVSQG